MIRRPHRREPTLTLATPQQAHQLLKAAAERMNEGTILVACLDRHRRLVDLLPVEGQDENLPEVAATLAEAPEPVAEVLVATLRRQSVPADKPEDEERWEAMQAAFAGSRVRLLDWFVICGGRWAWSVAELAVTPAAW